MTSSKYFFHLSGDMGVICIFLSPGMCLEDLDTVLGGNSSLIAYMIFYGSGNKNDNFNHNTRPI